MSPLATNGETPDHDAYLELAGTINSLMKWSMNGRASQASALARQTYSGM